LRAVTPQELIGPRVLDASSFCDFDAFDHLPPQLRAKTVVDDVELLELQRCEVVHGHFPLPRLLRITTPTQVATVVREPRARLLSLWSFWRLTPGVPENFRHYHAPLHARRPLAEMLAEPTVAGQTDNGICRMLLGEHTRIPPNGFIDPEAIPQIAQEAISALETLGFVGVLELGAGTWEGFARFFDLDLEQTHSNATAAGGSAAAERTPIRGITAEALDLLRDRTAADALVYESVLSRRAHTDADIARRRAEAFASQLVRTGDVAGPTAAQTTAAVDLSVRLQAEVLQTRAALEQVTTELELHREWLSQLQSSASWRITAPLRASKRRLWSKRPR
jgi:hypothetical protein